jgi:hypothetical protein
MEAAEALGSAALEDALGDRGGIVGAEATADTAVAAIADELGAALLSVGAGGTAA